MQNAENGAARAAHIRLDRRSYGTGLTGLLVIRRSEELGITITAKLLKQAYGGAITATVEMVFDGLDRTELLGHPKWVHDANGARFVDKDAGPFRVAEKILVALSAQLSSLAYLEEQRLLACYREASEACIVAGLDEATRDAASKRRRATEEELVEFRDVFAEEPPPETPPVATPAPMAAPAPEPTETPTTSEKTLAEIVAEGHED